MTFKIRKHPCWTEIIFQNVALSMYLSFPSVDNDNHKYCYLYVNFVFLSLLQWLLCHHRCPTAWIIGLCSKSQCSSSLLVNRRKGTNKKFLLPLSKPMADPVFVT